MSKRSTPVLLSPALLLSACGPLGAPPDPVEFAEDLTNGMPERPAPANTSATQARAPLSRQPGSGSPPAVTFDRNKTGETATTTTTTPMDDTATTTTTTDTGMTGH